MGGQNGPVRRAGRETGLLRVQGGEIGLQPREPLVERRAVLGPALGQSGVDRAGLLQSQRGIEPRREGRGLVGVLALGPMAVGHGLGHRQVAIGKARGRIDQLAFRKADATDPACVSGAVQKDQVGRLIGRDDFGSG